MIMLAFRVGRRTGYGKTGLLESPAVAVPDGGRIISVDEFLGTASFAPEVLTDSMQRRLTSLGPPRCRFKESSKVTLNCSREQV